MGHQIRLCRKSEDVAYAGHVVLEEARTTQDGGGGDSCGFAYWGARHQMLHSAGEAKMRLALPFLVLIM